MERKLTIDHFTGRALYFLGKFEKAEEIFEKNLKDYDDRGNVHATAYNNAWLARVNISLKNKVKAKRFKEAAVKFFEKESKKRKSQHVLEAAYIIEAEYNNFVADYEKAIKNSISALAVNLPPGSYKDGVWEAVAELVKAVGSTSKI